MAFPVRVLKHRAPSDKAFLFDRKARKHQHPRQIDPIILSITVDGRIGAKQWSFHGTIADAG